MPGASFPPAGGVWGWIRSVLPEGQNLPAIAWERRHKIILGIIVLHAIVLGAYAALGASAWWHPFLEGGAIGVFAVAALWPKLSRRVRSCLSAAGLMTSSAVLTHLSGGYIEAHFHFFIAIGIIALYEDWAPFLLGIGYVVMHHGIMGTVDAASVFNHPAAIARPWLWASIHAVAILAMSAAAITTWRVNESERARALESVARQRAVTETTLDAVITIDARGTVTEFNPAAERIFGYARDEAIGREMAELIIPAELREAHRHGLARVAAGGPPRVSGTRIEITAQRKDSSRFPAEVAIVRVPLDGEPQFTGYLRDLTAQHKARAELDATRMQLARSEKLTAVGQLVGGVAHEVRTPLTYLNTNLHLIERRLARIRDRLPEDLRAELDAVPHQMRETLAAAERIDHLVEDLRRYSKLKIGSASDESLDRLAREAVDLFMATNRGGIEVRADLRATSIIRAEAVHVQQIVLNLLQNAAEATPKGGHVAIETRDEGTDALLVVSDTGGGIDPLIQERIFDPFFTTKADGTGLGLSIVKRLADEHKATIRLESSARGTTFTLKFPRAPPREVPMRPGGPREASPRVRS